MHNNYFFLRKLAEELDSSFRGMQLLACFSQEKDEVVLGFSNNQFIKCILKSEFSAITVVDDFSRARKNSVSLWEVLYGAEVLKISVFANERAIEIILENEFTLVIKLFGNRSNLLVYKSEMLISLFNNKLQTDKSFKIVDFNRELEVNYDVFKEADGNYRKLFFTFGKDIFEDLDKVLGGLTLQEKWRKIQEFHQYLQEPDFFINTEGVLPKLSLLKGNVMPNAVSAINEFVIHYQKISATDRLKSDLIHKFKKDITKTQNYISVTFAKLEALKSGVKNEEIGNIIMANLHEINENIEEVQLLNFYTNHPIRIKLKKELTPQKNAESYYRKSKNEKIEIDTIERNLKVAAEKLLKLEESLVIVNEFTDLRSLRNLSRGFLAQEKSTQKEDFPFKEYVYKGFKIWVGRNAKNNDLLLTQYTQKDDWWLHARDTSGSHVIIKGQNPSLEVIEYAASIAAFYSKRRSESLVTVIYTQKKYVRKAKNLAAGQVIVEKEKTLLVEPRNG